MKKCKACQSEIDVKATKCPNCKSDQRNWFRRHKIISAILVLIILSGIGAGLASNSTSDQDSITYRFTDRADKQAKDVEIIVGESGTVDGRKLTVTSAEYKTSLDEYTQADSGKTYLVVAITIENTSDEVKTYNMFDFRIQTTSGQVLDPSIFGDNTLGSGDLVAGGKVSGGVTFEVPVETDNQYIIYKPNPYMSDRVIVEVKQP